MNYLLTTGTVSLAIWSYLYFGISEAFVCLALLLALLLLHVLNELREQPTESYRQYNFFIIALTLFVFSLVSAYLIRCSLATGDMASVTKYGFMIVSTIGTTAFFLLKRF